MKIILKMAFRNIFRNKKRSFLTILILVIGISCSLVCLSWFDGVQNMMKNEGTKITGDIRITAKNFDLKSNSLDLSSNVSYNKIKKNVELYSNNIKSVTGRINFGAMIYLNKKNINSLGHGITKQDYKIMNFKNYIFSGNFLKNSKEIIVGSALLKKYHLKLNQEITVLSMTQFQSLSAENYKIVGFYKMENNIMNKGFYINLKDAQNLLDMNGRVTKFLLYLKNSGKSKYISSELKKKLSQNYLVKPWYGIGINEVSTQMIKPVKMMFALILFILASIGIANTMVMVVFERKYEIGILKSIGMTNPEIKKLFCLEGAILGFLGSLFACIIGGSIAFYYSKVGLTFGNLNSTLSTSMNMPQTLYAKISINLLLICMILGVLSSVVVTLISTYFEIKKEIVDNLKI